MPKPTDLWFQIVGVGWLVIGGLFFLWALIGLYFWAIFGGFYPVTVFFILSAIVSIGSIQVFNGCALLRRRLVARKPVIVMSSVLLIPSVALIAAFGIGLFPSSLVLASLWLMLSSRGKQAFRAYSRRAPRNGWYQ